ncbi:hypothetical protein WME90_08155 [Sorangium sp. So ce375]|uniref:hypothetical protein n=1 Tax=Sorangium sp. So ce375 TaxID=3133306 RepID=UPI003F5BAF4D
MRTSAIVVAAFLGLAFSPQLVTDACADGEVQPKPKSKATKASVLAAKQKLEKARDAMRALAATAAPEGLTPAQKKAFAAEMTKLAEDAEAAHAVVKKIDASLDQVKADLDAMSEMGEMESLRLQMAMDRLSKMMSTLSNLLKKISDTANQITQNLK